MQWDFLTISTTFITCIKVAYTPQAPQNLFTESSTPGGAGGREGVPAPGGHSSHLQRCRGSLRHSLEPPLESHSKPGVGHGTQLPWELGKSRKSRCHCAPSCQSPGHHPQAAKVHWPTSPPSSGKADVSLNKTEVSKCSVSQKNRTCPGMVPYENSHAVNYLRMRLLFFRAGTCNVVSFYFSCHLL